MLLTTERFLEVPIESWPESTELRSDTLID